MARKPPPIVAPAWRALLGEARAPLEAAVFWLAADRLANLPHGDGHPVMFLPAFGMGDEGLRPLARVIARLGYACCGWDQGRNLGLSAAVAARLLRRLDDLRLAARARVSLVGWSAGGLYARELARQRPDLVRRVITLGAPIRPQDTGQPLLDGVRRVFEELLVGSGPQALVPDPAAPPVPCTSIHSRSDGVVAWRATLESAGPDSENIEVDGSHLGLGFNLEVLQIIAARLALPATQRRAAKRAAPRRKDP
jgi:pimeloyl-ACP methyl ester carboxylesterase